MTSRSLAIAGFPPQAARATLVAVLASLLVLPADAQPEAPDAQPHHYQHGVIVRFEGFISPMLEAYVLRKLDEARSRGADLLILEIDSPGGMIEESLNLADTMRDLGWAHTVAYVPKMALSGAAIVALGCDDIIMAPLARLGDAGPIVMGPDGLFRHAQEKIRSDLARRVRDLAEAKGRPPALAEAMVDSDLIVFEVRQKTTGEIRYLTDLDIQSTADPKDWEKIKPVAESRAGVFLEVNGKRAVELGLAQGLAADRNALSQYYGLTSAPEVLAPTAVDTAVYVLNLPLITFLLLLVGLVALYIELSAPGISIGGLIAGLCFALFFWSRFLGGTAGLLEVILFLAGGVFLALELFVIPGFGVAGISGLLLLLAALLMATQRHILPRGPRDVESLRRFGMILGSAFACFLVVAYFITRYFGRLPVVSRLVLGPPTPVTENNIDKQTGKPRPPVAGVYAVQVGDWGVAVSPLRPAGKADFAGQYVDVVADGSFVEAGRQVRVAEVSGNRVVVREVDLPPA